MRQVLVQNTGAFTGTVATPDLVADGKIACFSASGTPIQMSGTAFPAAGGFLVQGRDAPDNPILTPIIRGSDILSATLQVYVAPVRKLVTISSVPAGPTGGDTYVVKVVNLKTSTEPFIRKNYEIPVPASQTDEDSIYALVQVNKDDKGLNKFVDFGCNKIATGVISTTSGSLGIVVTDGENATAITYIQVYNSSLAATGAAFVVAYAAAILARFGIVVTFDTATFTFTGSAGSGGGAISAGDFTILDDGSGGCTMAAPGYTEATTLLIRAIKSEDNFQVFLNDVTTTGISAATQTVTNAFAEGSGWWEQIQQAEEEAAGGFSNQYREAAQPLIPETFAIPGGTAAGQYDQYTIIIATNQEGQSPVKGNQYWELTIAYHVDVTGTLATFLAAYL